MVNLERHVPWARFWHVSVREQHYPRWYGKSSYPGKIFFFVKVVLAKAKYQSFLFRIPREVLYWLDAWPAGLKLNAQLSRFYVNTLVGVIDTWECQSFLIPRSILLNLIEIWCNSAILPPLSPPIFTTLGFLSYIGGLTLLLSLISDLLSLFLTIHLRIGYEFTRAVYWAAGVRLGGGLLWGVFRGDYFFNQISQTAHKY